MTASGTNPNPTRTRRRRVPPCSVRMRGGFNNAPPSAAATGFGGTFASASDVKKGVHSTRVGIDERVGSQCRRGGITMATMVAVRPVHRSERRNLVRHFVEMVLAMLVGMAVLGMVTGGVRGAGALGVLVGSHQGIRVWVMALNMTIGMAVWMRHRVMVGQRPARWALRCSCRWGC